jgi:hypothetical protein
MAERPRLERRPEARSFTVEALLQLVQEGRIRLPEFQRPLRWRASHVLELFDSVYRGFPVGELLFAKGPADAALLHFGPVHIQAPEVGDALFVVDGQQRITSLAGAMMHPDRRPRGDIHAVWFDLVEEKFLRATMLDAPPHWIPMNVLGDSFKQLQWLNEWPLRNERPDLVQRAILLGKLLREYQIPAYIVQGASQDGLRIIFKRVNTSGVEMKEHEVFEALFGTTERQPIASACARLAQIGFGPIEEAYFLRCLKAVEGQDPRKSYREGDETSQRPSPSAVENTERALQRAMGFLAEDAGIPHVRLLPYTLLPLVVLSRFFHLNPQPSTRTRTLLARWVWRGALSGAHADSNYPTVNDYQQCIDKDEASSVEHLLERVPREVEFPDPSTPWRWSSARTKLCALALIHLKPRDPVTGIALDTDDLQARVNKEEEETHQLSFDMNIQKRGKRHEVGRLFLDVSGQKRTTVARHVLLADRRQIEKLLDAPPEVLQSHAMDEAAVEALRRKDFVAFESHRARVLGPWLQRFFQERSAQDESDRPAIADLVRRADEAAAPP